MNSLNIPACHTSLGQITFPFSTDGSGSHQAPHLGNHEVATVTKKQKPQIFLFFNKKGQYLPFDQCQSRTSIYVFQIIDKLPIKQEALIQFKPSSLGNRAGRKQKPRQELYRRRQSRDSRL